MDDALNVEGAPAVAVQRVVRQRPLNPVWNWESTGSNGGKIIGSCKTPKELGEMVAKLAEHPETELIRIAKFRRDYDPMIPIEKMQDIINATSDDRKIIIRELSNKGVSMTLYLANHRTASLRMALEIMHTKQELADILYDLRRAASVREAHGKTENSAEFCEKIEALIDGDEEVRNWVENEIDEHWL